MTAPRARTVTMMTMASKFRRTRLNEENSSLFFPNANRKRSRQTHKAQEGISVSYVLQVWAQQTPIFHPPNRVVLSRQHRHGTQHAQTARAERPAKPISLSGVTDLDSDRVTAQQQAAAAGRQNRIAHCCRWISSLRERAVYCIYPSTTIVLVTRPPGPPAAARPTA